MTIPLEAYERAVRGMIAAAKAEGLTLVAVRYEGVRLFENCLEPPEEIEKELMADLIPGDWYFALPSDKR